METSDQKQKIIDDEHLKLLSLFNYISGGLTLLFAFFVGAYFIIIFSVISSADFQQELNPAMNGQMPDAVFKVMLFVMISFAAAIVNLLLFPYGTILGIFTMVVLERNSVKDQYLLTVEQENIEDSSGI
ncbi:MAG: hypothetical protein P8X42_13420 [Calditrichaceae bacterium]